MQDIDVDWRVGDEINGDLHMAYSCRDCRKRMDAGWADKASGSWS